MGCSDPGMRGPEMKVEDPQQLCLLLSVLHSMASLPSPCPSRMGRWQC